VVLENLRFAGKSGFSKVLENISGRPMSPGKTADF
jgi:hypothetical protein